MCSLVTRDVLLILLQSDLLLCAQRKELSLSLFLLSSFSLYSFPLFLRSWPSVPASNKFDFPQGDYRSINGSDVLLFVRVNFFPFIPNGFTNFRFFFTSCAFFSLFFFFFCHLINFAD